MVKGDIKNIEVPFALGKLYPMLLC